MAVVTDPKTVRRLAQRRATAEQRLREAEDAYRDALREAYENGYTVMEIHNVTGISRTSLYRQLEK
jgi:hypothetical protein